MAQIVRYTGDSTFRMLQLGIDVSPDDPLHEVDDDVASYLIQNHPFEAYDGTEADVPTTLYSLFVSGEDINPTSVGKETPADFIGVDALDVVEELGLPEYDDVTTATQSAGHVIYATGDGPSAEGVYAHDGTGFVKLPGSSEAVRDTVADFVTAGADIAVSHDDSGDTLTVAFTGDIPTELATGTVTAAGGATPAVGTAINGVTDDQLQAFDVIVSPESDPAWNGDYAFNVDWSWRWDDSDGQVDVSLTVNWDIDPGSGNDLPLRYSIQERGL